MQKPSIIISIFILVGLFLYALQIVSDSNICTGVRSFLCQKQTQQSPDLVVQGLTQSGGDQNPEAQSGMLSQDQQAQSANSNPIIDSTSAAYGSVKKMGDSFIHLCNPEITESTGGYIADYSKCSLNVTVSQDQKTVQGVNVNGTNLTQSQINENLVKLWFSF